MTDDKVSKWRNHFSITQECVYLDHAFAGPLSNDAAAAVQRATESHAKGASKTFGALIRECDNVRGLFADFIGATREEIAMVNTTSMGISIVANGLTWNPGDSIVIPQIEYLSNAFPWLNLEARGVEVRKVPCPRGRVRVDDLMKAADSSTRVLSVSWVQFSNGYRVDIAALGEACRSRNILFVVDANHAVGALNFSVRRLPIDVLVTQSFKWLCGPYNVGWLFVRRNLIEKIRPTAVGPLSAIPGESFLDQKFRLRTDAQRFETGVPNFSGVIGAGASLKLFASVGMSAIETRLRHLTSYLVEGLLRCGYNVLSARGKWEEQSGITICRHPRPDMADFPFQDIPKTEGRDHQEARSKGLDRRGKDPWHTACLHRLAASGVIVSVREGALRVSPHFYNTEDEIDQFLDALP